MANLSAPGKDLAAKILGKVRDEEALGSYRLTASGGNAFYPLYSFQDAVSFLHADNFQLLMSHGNGGSVAYINLDVLQGWVREVFGDSELAEAINQEKARHEGYVDQAEAVSTLMRERLGQCIGLTGEESAGKSPAI